MFHCDDKEHNQMLDTVMSNQNGFLLRIFCLTVKSMFSQILRSSKHNAENHMTFHSNMIYTVGSLEMCFGLLTSYCVSLLIQQL